MFEISNERENRLINEPDFPENFICDSKAQRISIFRYLNENLMPFQVQTEFDVIANSG